MSQKREKKIRRIARYLYGCRFQTWKRAEPPRWRFIARRNWMKAKPQYEAEEKFVRKCVSK